MSITVNTAGLKRAKTTFQERFVNRMEQNLVLAAKRTGFYLMEYTLPISNASKPFPIEGLRDRIEGDIVSVYPSVGDTNWIGNAYSLIEDNLSKESANKFWNNYKLQGKDEGVYDAESGGFVPRKTPEEAFASIRKIPRKVDDKGYGQLLKSKAIKSKSGARRLPDGLRPLAMVGSSQRDKFIRDRQKKAGLAKSAWWQSVKSLGGQINYNNSNFAEGNFIFPPELSKIAGRNPGIGSFAKMIDFGKGGQIRITNNLRYASEALLPHSLTKAKELAENAMRILFEKRAKAAADAATKAAATRLAKKAA